jgi:cobalamin biosynthesis protein CobT
VVVDKGIPDELAVLTGRTGLDLDTKVSPLQVQMDKMFDAVSEARDEAKASKHIRLLNTLP